MWAQITKALEILERIAKALEQLADDSLARRNAAAGYPDKLKDLEEANHGARLRR